MKVGENMIEGFFKSSSSGDSQTNYDALKYSEITSLIAIIHTIFSLAFLAMQITPMVIYNVLVVIMYLILARNIANIKNFTKIYYVYLTEIVFHCVFATLMIGWNYYFMFYLIILIPISFYIAFSISSFKRRLIHPITTTIIVVVAYFTMRIITYYINPFYYGKHFFEVFFCIVNSLIAFGGTLLFSAMFAVEVNSMQLLMESEQEKLEDQASYDPLTHFLNRRSMEDKLNNAHRNAIINNIPYSLIMCDIDNFKHFNDTYGHDCGDFVLQNISKIISTQVRGKDYTCRWGGEEFLILVSDNSIEIASEVAERIRDAIDKHEFYYEGQSLHVTITLGVSSYYASSKFKTLIEIADKRLYKGKQNGKNQVVFQ